MVFQFLRNKLQPGIDLMKNKKVDEAISYFQTLLNSDPKNVDVYIELARAFFKKNNFQQTAQFLLKMLDLNLSQEHVETILEITNHYMLVHNKFINNSPMFSPDGTKVVYTSVRNDTNNDGKIDINDRAGVYILDINTKIETELISDKYHNVSPIFSADGEKIVCLSTRRDTNKDRAINYQDNPELCVINLKTGDEKLYISGEWRFKHPSLSPNGKHLLFCGWRPGGTISGIYIWDLETGATKRISREGFDSTFPTYSPDGKTIIYTSWRFDTNGDGIIDIRDNSGIYAYDLEKDMEYQIVPDNFDNRFPTFSHDGKKIMFLSRRSDTNNDGKINTFDNPGIFLLDLKSQKEQCIVDDKHYNLFPTFCRNDDEIIYLGS